LKPSDYIIGPASGNPNLCFSWPRGLPPSSDGIDWQLGKSRHQVCILVSFLRARKQGSAFLQTVYSVFRYDNLALALCFALIYVIAMVSMGESLPKSVYSLSIPI